MQGGGRLKRGCLPGTHIRYFSVRFLRVMSVAVLLSLATLVASAIFSIVLAISRRRRSFPDGERDGFELICISHVPWDEVWQRNQQTMSRISRNEKVIYARPVHAIEVSDNMRHLASFFGRRVDGGDLTILSPIVLWGETRFAAVRCLNRWIALSSIRYCMVRSGYGGRPLVLWFYFPKWEHICGGLGEDLVVYDIQDEYLTWTNATKDIDVRERRLLARSDIVFTGTNSLARKKKEMNRNIHFIQNGVEADHFALALREDTKIPALLMAVPKPVIGYFGLIGDRIDPAILEIIADTHPEWSLVLIGPVREDLCTLPKRSNILLTGQVDYEELPGYLKGFDVAIIPYHMNETTMDLNPTKLLEYLAGGKRVVSTAMNDVVEFFEDYVGVAHDPQSFLALTEEAVERPDEAFIRNGIAFANGFNWEAMVDRIRRMLIQALAARRGENGSLK